MIIPRKQRAQVSEEDRSRATFNVRDVSGVLVDPRLEVTYTLHGKGRVWLRRADPRDIERAIREGEVSINVAEYPDAFAVYLKDIGLRVVVVRQEYLEQHEEGKVNKVKTVWFEDGKIGSWRKPRHPDEGGNWKDFSFWESARDCHFLDEKRIEVQKENVKLITQVSNLKAKIVTLEAAVQSQAQQPHLQGFPHQQHFPHQAAYGQGQPLQPHVSIPYQGFTHHSNPPYLPPRQGGGYAENGGQRLGYCGPRYDRDTSHQVPPYGGYGHRDSCHRLDEDVNGHYVPREDQCAYDVEDVLRSTCPQYGRDHVDSHRSCDHEDGNDTGNEPALKRPRYR
jgi:hypothetical protein